MRLDHPAVLLAALPVLLAILLLARRGAQPVRRPALSFALRFLILLSLAAVLAAPTIAAPRPGPSVVFALDVSDSVTDEALERAVAAIQDASKAVAGRGGESTLVLYAGRALVARPPSPEPIDFTPDLRRRIFARRAAAEAASQDRAPSPGAPARDELEPLVTRSASAVLLARRLNREESKTLVITDGRETDPASPPPEGS